MAKVGRIGSSDRLKIFPVSIKQSQECSQTKQSHRVIEPQHTTRGEVAVTGI